MSNQPSRQPDARQDSVGDHAGDMEHARQTPQIIISGVDEPEPGEHNLTPTEEAAERLKLQREREDPEDEDG